MPAGGSSTAARGCAMADPKLSQANPEEPLNDQLGAMNSEQENSPTPASEAATSSPPKDFFVRFVPVQRMEHWIFMASFTLLGITGLVQKYSFNPISEAAIPWLGGLDNGRLAP